MSVIFRPSVKRRVGRDLVASFHNLHIKCGNLLWFHQIYMENAVTCTYYVAALKVFQCLVAVVIVVVINFVVVLQS